MKNKILQWMVLLMSGALLAIMPCCTKENNDWNNNSENNDSGGGNSGGNNGSQIIYPWDNYTPTSYDIQLENKLLNTSWNWSKDIHYHASSGNTTIYTPSNSGSDFIYSELSYRDSHSIYIDGQKKGYWWIKNGKICQTFINITHAPDFECTDFQAGELASQFGACGNESSVTIITLTETAFIWRLNFDNGNYSIFYYTRSSGGGGNGGGNSSYELPDVGFYDFDAGLYSLIVKYKIYNNSDANVSSAKVYYGTTSNPTRRVNATISGTIITSHITGLSSGTEYYVKCEATGPGGTTTTSVTKLITQFP